MHSLYPQVADLVDSLSGHRYFSTLDLASGYWQVPMEESSQEKTAFVIPGGGHFEFLRMPFGLTNAVPTFQRLMSVVLEGLLPLRCLVYLDDVLVIGRSFEQYLENLEAVLEAICKAGLKLKPSKCHFAQSSADFLGFTISDSGLSPDSKKVEAISRYPTPKDLTELRRFLGMASYYRRFISGFSDIASPLNRLTQKDMPFVWDENCENAFQTIKEQLMSSPVLAFPEPNGDYILYTDASDVGVGAVLVQEDEGGEERVISYASKAFSGSEKNWTTTEKEAYAVVWALQYFHPYVYGRKVVIYTDHKALKWLKNVKHPNGKLARWILKLEEYDYTIEHKPGNMMQHADALSRAPVNSIRISTLSWTELEETQNLDDDILCIKPDPEKIQAILEMPHPTNLHEVRSFHGMVNQFSKFTPNLADLTKPIRELLVKNIAWTWGPPQQDAFDKIKKALTSAPILTLYDPNKATKIAADASSYGLGAVVLQEEPDTWKPVSFISRSMTTTEARYAQIEKEALAVTWACERSSNYIIGKPITIETDHKPLVPLLTNHTIDKLPPRLQRYKMRLMRFHIKDVRHVPGKLHYTADTLSRKIPESTVQPTVEENEMNAYVSSVTDALPASNPRLKEIQQAQDEDEVCKEVKKYCMDQWTEKDHVTPVVKPYWSVQGELTIADGLLLKGTRLVIPSRLQRQTLNQIHEGHQGISKCRERAKISVWWPGLSAQIKVMVENCTTCSKYRQQHPEPLMPTPLPQRPWQLIATDLFILEKVTYLLVGDYYSRYVEVVALPKSTSSSKIIQALKTIFARHGITMRLNIIVTNSPSLQRSGDSNTVPAAVVILKRTAKWNEQ